jgi:hypothetical protein
LFAKHIALFSFYLAKDLYFLDSMNCLAYFVFTTFATFYLYDGTPATTIGASMQGYGLVSTPNKADSVTAGCA